MINPPTRSPHRISQWRKISQPLSVLWLLYGINWWHGKGSILAESKNMRCVDESGRQQRRALLMLGYASFWLLGVEMWPLHSWYVQISSTPLTSCCSLFDLEQSLRSQTLWFYFSVRHLFRSNFVDDKWICPIAIASTWRFSCLVCLIRTISRPSRGVLEVVDRRFILKTTRDNQTWALLPRVFRVDCCAIGQIWG